MLFYSFIMLSQFGDQRTMSGLEYKLIVLCLCTPVSPIVSEMEGIIYAAGQESFFEDVPLVSCIYSNARRELP